MSVLLRPRLGADRAGWLRISTVLLVAYVVLTAAAYAAHALYMQAWLPLLAREIDWLLEPMGFARKTLELVTEQGEQLISLDALATRPISYRHSVPPARIPVFFATTLQAYALLHPAVIYSILIAWPAESLRHRLSMLAWGLPCVVITTSLDFPFVLTGMIRTTVLERYAPERLAYDPVVVYSEFLHRGGRLGLAVTAAFVVALVAGRVARMRMGRSSLAETKS